MHRIAALRSSALVLLSAALLAGALAGCAATPSATREYQDPRTAVTVTVAGRSLLFAEALAPYGVNARNYLSIVPVEINRGGAKSLYWYGYAWSTIDKRLGHAPPGQFVLVADGRQIPLALQDTTLEELGISEAPVKAPGGDARMVVALATRPDMRIVAGSSELGALGNRDGTLESYDLWEDGRTAVEAFLNGDVPDR